MAYLPEGTPLPEPVDRDEAHFYEWCNRRELRIQRCGACGHFRHPPGPACPRCRSMEIDWVQVTGEGEVFTHMVAHHPVHAALKEAVPYNVVLVRLDGAGDVRLVSNLVDAGPDEPRIGMRVSLAWDEVAPGRFLPRFRKAEGSK